MTPTTITMGIAVSSVTDVTPAGSAQGARIRPPEPRLCRELSLAGRPMAVDVFVFAADDYNASGGSLTGCRFRDGEWRREAVPLPDVVYDRSFCTGAEQRRRLRSALGDMAARKPHRLLNGRLPSKLAVYECLRQDPRLAPHLPETVPFESADRLVEAVRRLGGGVMVKPAAGMQGRGVVRLRREWSSGLVQAEGRSGINRPFKVSFGSERELSRWLSDFMKQSPFLVQPYLRLLDENGRPWDIRALLQKDGSGRWAATGTAARLGRTGTLTSNLHGGGEAVRADALLWARFGKSRGERLLEAVHTISRRAASRLESGFGRYGELAFDFGIEPDGRLWLLEANAKPGREAFRLTGDAEAQRLSVERPLQYARYLFNLAQGRTAMPAGRARSRTKALTVGNGQFEGLDL